VYTTPLRRRSRSSVSATLLVYLYTDVFVCRVFCACIYAMSRPRLSHFLLIEGHSGEFNVDLIAKFGKFNYSKYNIRIVLFINFIYNIVNIHLYVLYIRFYLLFYHFYSFLHSIFRKILSDLIFFVNDNEMIYALLLCYVKSPFVTSYYSSVKVIDFLQLM